MNRQPSHLFTVRIWKEKLNDDHTEWRGTVRHVLSGETNHFREWTNLIKYLERVFCEQQLNAVPEKGKDR